MKEFFIKGKKVKPGLTIAIGRRTYVVTNEYKLHYVESGNHAEVHATGSEIWSVKQYLMMRPFIILGETFKHFGKLLNGKE